MIYKTTKIEGVIIIEPEPLRDKRGYFARIFSSDEALKKIDFKITQINQSLTLKKGTIRGLHYQKKPKEEAKIVQCLRGRVYDVVLDLRKDSPDYGRWLAEELNEENKKMIYIPEGLAQGFQALTNNCLVQYFMSEFYFPKHASGIRWNDPAFGIKWPITNPILSEKDKHWPLVKS